MILALLCMHGFGLVHGDLKSDHMVRPRGTIYLIDFGSVCGPGACGKYRPPAADVSLSWHVYSIGLMLQELGAEGSEGLEMCPRVKALCSEMSAEAAEERPCLR